MRSATATQVGASERALASAGGETVGGNDGSGLHAEMGVASEPAGPAPVVVQPFYLHVGSTSAFATAHLPADGRMRSTAILFCPPLALKEQCSHRVRRDWAQELAGHGYPVLRFDLPGYGDSSDCGPDADQVETWIETVREAATWLRRETRCTRVAALGISFGGTLAWASAAQGVAIDDLVLWGTPTKGSRLIREIHAGALVLIDPRITTDADDGSAQPRTKDSGLPQGAMLDDSGQVIQRQTVQAVSALDLKKLPLKDPSSRRILLFERPGDGDLREHLQSTGAELTVRPGERYDEMMQYVQFSRLPASASRDLLAWLEQGASAPARAEIDLDIGGESGGPAGPPPVTSQWVEFTYNGVSIRESLVSVEVDGCTLRGVVTEPAATESPGLCGVFFSAGSDRRTGQNRLWVGAARRWAAAGVPSVRLDPPGVGDSDGECEDNGTLHGRYQESIVHRTVPILDGVATLGLPQRFMVAGICSGGWRGVRAAMLDDRIVGVYAVDFPFFRWNWWIVHLRESWIDTRQPRLDESPSRRLALRSIKTAMRIAQPLRKLLINSRLRSRRNQRAFERLRANGTQLSFLFREASDQLEEMIGDLATAERAVGANVDDVTVHVAPGFDPQYRPIPIREYINTTLDDALARVRGGSAAPVASGTGATADAVTVQHQTSNADRRDSVFGPERC